MGTGVLAIIVDEFTSSPSGGCLAQSLVREVINQWCAEPQPCPKRLEVLVRNAHTKLRYRYPLAKAAYAALLLEKNSSTAWALVCGDCRVGVYMGGFVRWLTEPHTLSVAACAAGISSNATDVFSVTRCFKPSRWVAPQIIRLDGYDGALWSLATDGFTCLPPTQWGEPGEDDSSCITFDWNSVVPDSEVNGNWYGRRGDSARA